MAKILHIHTALETAIICLSDGERLLGERTNPSQRDHASFLHVGIRELVRDAGMSMTDLEAIQVVEGPGSYTGLRVGMAAAKGLCYALSIPLITCNTLAWMALGLKAHPREMLRCPMIDARRMEVFTAIFEAEGQMIMPTTPVILTPDSFNGWLGDRKILFFGNGAGKFRDICEHPNALFTECISGSPELIVHALDRVNRKNFADTAYAEPYYGKAFHTTASVKI
jgi:tRNA threonylcarbamoyladenosine biosynthesis protein TsaB